jgi:MFS transporter
MAEDPPRQLPLMLRNFNGVKLRHHRSLHRNMPFQVSNRRPARPELRAVPQTIDRLEPAPATRKWLIAVAVMLGTTLEVLDSSIINVALPHLQGAFSASVDEIAWVLTSYLAANGITIPMTGWISSRFGRKRYFLFSVLVFVSASALCGAAQSLTNGGVPPDPGRRRGGDDPVLASQPDGNLSARRTAAGDGGLGHAPNGRTHRGTHARRMDYR